MIVIHLAHDEHPAHCVSHQPSIDRREEVRLAAYFAVTMIGLASIIQDCYVNYFSPQRCHRAQIWVLMASQQCRWNIKQIPSDVLLHFIPHSLLLPLTIQCGANLMLYLKFIPWAILQLGG